MSSTAQLAPNGVSGSGTVRKINRFLTTPFYIGLLAVLTLLSNTMCLEPVMIFAVAALVIYVCFFGDDLLPLMPLSAFCYIAPSVGNNPGRNETTIFSGTWGIVLVAVAAVAAVSIIIRVIRDRKQYKEKKYRLLSGMLILSVAYFLGGIFRDGYSEVASRNLIFTLLQVLSLCLLYLLFSGGVRWENAPKNYFAWIGFSAGLVLVLEIFNIYLQAEVVVDGVINRGNIYTGWGIHNNMGGMLAMMIPFAFYLACRNGRGWVGTLTGGILLIGVVLSCSRNAILTSGCIFALCTLLMLFYSKKRKRDLIAIGIMAGVAAVLLLIFAKKLLHLYSDLLSMGLSPNSRDSIYSKGIELFKMYPLFGGAFFAPEGYQPWTWALTEGFTSFFPARWHNTVVQMLASCGIVGMGAYLLHRGQTVLLFLRSHNREKTFIGCSILALLVCSLFDCHFFNLGPTLFYSAALAFAENCHPETEEK